MVAIMRHFVFVLISVALAACASGKPQRDGQASNADEPKVMQDYPKSDSEQTVETTTVEEAKKAPLLDRTQQRLFGITSGAAQKFDNLFGSADVEEEATVSRGRLSVGGQWDKRNEFKKRVRLKARVALPAINERTSLIFGRGEADELVDGSDDANIDSLPSRFNDFDDEDWLLGIGYTRDAELKRGWSFGAGVKLATPLEPFLRATYRWNKTFSDDWLWRVEPRLFVQSQRGAGLSLTNTLDHVIFENWLLRSWSVAVVEEEAEGVAWTSKLIAYQDLPNNSAFSYAIYSTGETDYEVPVKDYGIELRYRRQMSREWLFVEFLTYVSWPREFLIEEREPVVGVGIEFEMQFGDWPGRRQQTRNDAHMERKR